MEKGQYTRTEIFSQPEAWSAALTVLDENRRAVLDLQPARRYSQVIYTGCGSTYYLSLAAAALTQESVSYTHLTLPTKRLV